jgi:hypothetical protein
MRILGTCSACRRRKLVVARRTYKHPKISAPITSDHDLCGPCFRKILKMVT